MSIKATGRGGVGRWPGGGRHWDRADGILMEPGTGAEQQAEGTFYQRNRRKGGGGGGAAGRGGGIKVSPGEV